MPVPAQPALGCSLREVTEPPRSSMALVISNHFLAVEVFSSPNEILSANSLFKIAKRGWSGGRRSQPAVFLGSPPTLLPQLRLRDLRAPQPSSEPTVKTKL